MTKFQTFNFSIMSKKIEKKEEVVLTKLQAAVFVDAMMVIYGQIVDQIPLDDLVSELSSHREKIVQSFKEKVNGK